MPDRTKLIEAGHAWAESQDRPEVPSTWTATWQEAIERGHAPRDRGHESAKFVAAVARARWRDLRPDAPRNVGNRTARRGRGPEGQFVAVYKLRCTADERETWRALEASEARAALTDAARRKSTRMS